MTDTNPPTFVFEGSELLGHALHAQLLARRRATFEHDIKNVVHGLLSGTELLSKSLATNSARISPAECLSLLQQQLGRAQSTLHRMLDEVAPSDAVPSEIAFAALVEECTHDLRHQLQRYQLTHTIAADLRVRATRATLKDALLALLLEAVDQAPLHSLVELDGGSSDAEHVRLSLRHTQATSSRPSSIPSLKHILQAEAGAIDVNATGETRVVTVTLPRLQDASPPRASGGLLIVDANRDAADSLAMLVQLEGFTAHAAYDLDSAVLEAQSSQPVALIVDVDGSIDTRALVAKVRASGARARIIGLSHGSEKRSADVDGQLRKPLDPGALRTILTQP